MLETLKFGKGNWANKTDSTLAYSDQYGNFQAIPFDFTRATTATRVNKQGLIESVNDGIARIDYSDSTQGALLLEPQSTNLITDSNDANDIGGGVVETSSGTSPDGTQNAFKLTFGVGQNDGATLYIGGSTALPSTEYTFSVYAKSVNGDGTFNVRIDTDTQALVDNNNFTSTSEWQRYSFTFTTDAACSSFTTNTRLRGVTDNNEILFYGLQVEELSYETSLIPTSGTIVTRNQEICKNATPVINSEEGVLYAEISALVDDAPHRWISLSDATTNNRVNFQYYTGSNEIRVEVRSEGVTSLNSFIIVTDITDFIKIGVKWKLNDFAVWINGVEVATSNTGNAPIGMSTLSFTHYGQSANPFFGNTKDLKIYNTALTDAQLQTLTTI